MEMRLAAILALCAFSLTLLVGLEAGNSFTTTVMRSLLAMACALVIGLFVGIMFKRLMDEHLAAERKRLNNP